MINENKRFALKTSSNITAKELRRQKIRHAVDDVVLAKELGIEVSDFVKINKDQ